MLKWSFHKVCNKNCHTFNFRGILTCTNPAMDTRATPTTECIGSSPPASSNTTTSSSRVRRDASRPGVRERSHSASSLQREVRKGFDCPELQHILVQTRTRPVHSSKHVQNVHTYAHLHTHNTHIHLKMRHAPFSACTMRGLRYTDTTLSRAPKEAGSQHT